MADKKKFAPVIEAPKYAGKPLDPAQFKKELEALRELYNADDSVLSGDEYDAALSNLKSRLVK